MKRLSIFGSYLLVSSILLIHLSCRSQSFNGVYAGVEVQINALGGALDRSDVTYYFRPDGTYTDDLKDRSWRTFVKGTYAKKGSALVLTNAKTGKERQLSITAKGNLQTSLGTLLVKLDGSNDLPAGRYKFTYAASSGGGGSGTTFIGASGATDFYFDGRGNFNKEGRSAVMISGESIGGGTSRDSAAAGTYSLKDGELTLKYKDGTVKKHSFFYAKEAEGMALLDGRIFFTDDEDEKKVKEKRNSTAITETSAGGKKEKEDGTALKPAGKTGPDLGILMSKKHGGPALKKMNTAEAHLTFRGVKIISKTDHNRKWSRIELWDKNKLVMVEQWEGSSGWQWLRGKKSALSATRAKEMKYSFYTGLSLLRSHSDKLQNASVEESAEGYTIVYEVDGNEFSIDTDKTGTIVAEAHRLSGKRFNQKYSNFKTVDGILVPFTETQDSGGEEAVLHMEKFMVNGLNEDAFKAPDL